MDGLQVQSPNQTVTSMAISSDGKVLYAATERAGVFKIQRVTVRLDLVDFDGDRKTDITIWRQESGYWYIINSSNGTTTYTPWGGGTDIPVPGDYDGDGKTDIAIWRPSTGSWYIIRSSDQSLVQVQWGVEGVNC